MRIRRGRSTRTALCRSRVEKSDSNCAEGNGGVIKQPFTGRSKDSASNRNRPNLESYLLAPNRLTELPASTCIRKLRLTIDFVTQVPPVISPPGESSQPPRLEKINPTPFRWTRFMNISILPSGSVSSENYIK